MRIQKRHFSLNINTTNRNEDTIYFHLRLFKLFSFTIFRLLKSKKLGFRGVIGNLYIGY